MQEDANQVKLVWKKYFDRESLQNLVEESDERKKKKRKLEDMMDEEKKTGLEGKTPEQNKGT